MSFGVLNNAVTGIAAGDISAFGYAVTVYRLGATVDDPNTLIPADATGRVIIPVVDTGDIKPGDTVDVSGDFSGEEYLVMSVGETGENTDDGVTNFPGKYIEIDLGADAVSDTAIADGVRMTPINDLPELDSAATSGQVVANPFTVPDADNGVFALYANADGKSYDVSATKSAATTYTGFDIEPFIAFPDTRPVVASATSISLPANAPNVVVSGTADIEEIEPQPCDTEVTLWFSGTAGTNGVVDGGNLSLAGDLAYDAGDSLTIVCDGTNWNEKCRSVNS